MIRLAPRASLVGLLASIALLATPAAAQIFPAPETPSGSNGDEAAAYLALTTTPVGALAPMIELPGLPGYTGRIQLHGQVGFAEQEGPSSTRNFGLGLSVPVAFGNLRLTGGLADFVCDDENLFGPGDGITLDCGTGFLAGADATISLLRPMLSGTTGGGFGVNLVVSLGASTNDVAQIDFEDPSDPAFSGTIDLRATTYSAAVGVPLSFVARSNAVLVIPHLTPRVGYGRSTIKVDVAIAGAGENTTETDGGLRPMLGAGVDILFGNPGFGLGFGLQKVFAEDSDMVIGINFSFLRR